MTAEIRAHSVKDFQSIGLDQLEESPFNPRKTYDKDKLQELADSIKDKGVLEPVLVRPQGAKFQLVAGHRRARAAQLAGLKEIPAIVRILNDRQALEVQVIENLQREDVNPMEEAAAYQVLVKTHGHHPKELAAKIGKSTGYVYRRLKLCELAKPVREALANDEITAAVAELIARIPGEKLQAEALEAIIDESYDGPASLKTAQDLIHRSYMLDLSQAPFDVKDAELVPAAGACSSCPRRTANNPDLFGDVAKKDTCTDPTCFAAKKAAAWQRKVAEVQKTGQRVLNEKETKRVFPYEHSSEPSYNSPYVDVKQICSEDPKRRTFEQLVGKAATKVLARDPRGGMHELIDKSQIPQLLKKAGHDFKAPRQNSDVSTFDNEQKAREKKAKLRRAAARLAMSELVTHLVSKEPSEALWRALTQAALDIAGADALGHVMTRREQPTKGAGWDKSKPLIASTKGMDVTGLRALAFEALLSTVAYPGAWATGYGQAFVDACEAAGIDLKKLQREVAAEANKPAAKKKARA